MPLINLLSTTFEKRVDLLPNHSKYVTLNGFPITQGLFFMANWCFINFTATGAADEMSRFRESISGSKEGCEMPLDFNRLIPMPSELGETTADFGQAYCVYYGDAERILAYPWITNLGIDTIEKLREHFDGNPEHRATADQQKVNIENTVPQAGLSGVFSTGAQSGTPMTSKSPRTGMAAFMSNLKRHGVFHSPISKN